MRSVDERGARRIVWAIWGTGIVVFVAFSIWLMVVLRG